jgi:hypothetical protein
MWDGHSCPSPLTLVLILEGDWFLGAGDSKRKIKNDKIKIKTRIKVKGDGQECPSHMNPHALYFVTCPRRRSTSKLLAAR